MSNRLSKQEAQERSRLLRVSGYGIALDLTGTGPTFPARTEVRFRARAGAATFINVTAARVRATLNGRPLPDSAFDGDRLQLDGLAEDNLLVVEADAEYSNAGAGLHRFVDPVDGNTYLHTQFEPFEAHRVFACFDQPDLKAPVTLSVRAPQDWVVVGNQPGTVVDGVWQFEPTVPLSSYLVVCVAGPYHRASSTRGETPLSLYCRQSLVPHLDVEDIFETTRAGLDYFEKLFDYPFPFAKYDQAFVPEFRSGAMENPGCVTFLEAFLFRSAATEGMLEQRASVILHEMAHMWFGDLVTMRWWDDLWLNESFATYLATRALAEATRHTGAWERFATGTKASAYRQDQLPTTHPIATEVTDTEALRLHFDGITYAKGAAVLRQLGALLGQDVFDAGVRNYFRRHEFGNAELTDFLAALEESAQQPLTAWARDWLQSAGVNTLRPELTPGQGTLHSVRLRQAAAAGAPTLRAHRLDLGLYSASGAQLELTDRVAVTVEGELTDVPALTGRPQPDLLLVNDGDLAYAKQRLDPVSLATAEERLPDLPDPLARSLVWATVWDMVSDGELACSRYERMVARHALREGDPTRVLGLFGQVTQGIERFADPSRRSAARRPLVEIAFQQLLAAGERPVACGWARAWTALVEDAADLALAEGLLAGHDLPPQLDVDVELRWGLVAALVRRDPGRLPLVEQQLAADPTDFGRRRAAGVRASAPTEEAKAAAWHDIVEDRDLPMATRRALTGAFAHPEQADLLRPYVQRYFEALPRVWAERDFDLALGMTMGLYPHAVIEPETVAATEAALATGELPPVATRILLEGADGLRRALRAQRVDREAAAGVG